MLQIVDKRRKVMFCKSCGRYNSDKDTKCRYCGGSLSESEIYRKSTSTYIPSYYSDRSLAGALLCIFLNFLGLAIGIVLYRGEERESFLLAWCKTFIILSIITFILSLAVFLPIMCSMY